MAQDPRRGPLRRTSIKEAVDLLSQRDERLRRLERGRPEEGATAQVRDVTDTMTFDESTSQTTSNLDDPAVSHCDVMDADFGISY